MAKRKHTRRAATTQYAAIPNQVFLGVPWKTVRPKYERIIDKLKKSYPIAFVIVGRDQNQDAEDLLEVIKKRLLTSSYAIFDATGGNANVSLEFGFADANDIPRALYLSIHRASKRASKESPIIADLAGKKQNRYAQEEALERLLRQFCQNHAYTRRFEQFLTTSFRHKSKGNKRRLRSLALKIVHQLAGDGRARRADVVQNLQADPSRYTRTEIDDMILRMHRNGLVESVQGPYSTVTVV
uniref:Uncharacterized protein n=1 Tax=Eiseniibacteriota bacterium TaxID=2212470 RepID=A0A832I860_UNCEI